MLKIMSKKLKLNLICHVLKSKISFWSKYTIWQLLKNILDVINNDVHIRKGLGKPCIHRLQDVLQQLSHIVLRSQ